MIVYLYGDEPFIIKQNMVRLEKDAEVMRSTSLEENELTFLRMNGFFGRHVLVLSKDSYSEKDALRIQGLGLEKSDNTLILTGKIAKNSKFYKWLEKECKVILCERYTEKEAPGFCAAVLSKYGAQITHNAANLFMERSGYYLKHGDLFMVRNSLKQLALMANEITEEVVMDFPQSEIVNRWKLVGLLGSDSGEFIRRVVLAERDGESAIGLLSIILRAFRISYKCKLVGTDALKEIGITPFQFRDMKWIVDRLSMEQIASAIGVLTDGVQGQKGNGDKTASFIRSLGNLVKIVYPSEGERR